MSPIKFNGVNGNIGFWCVVNTTPIYNDALSKRKSKKPDGSSENPKVLDLGRVQRMSSQELTYKKYPHTTNPGQNQKQLTEVLKIPKF